MYDFHHRNDYVLLHEYDDFDYYVRDHEHDYVLHVYGDSREKNHETRNPHEYEDYYFHGFSLLCDHDYELDSLI